MSTQVCRLVFVVLQSHVEDRRSPGKYEETWNVQLFRSIDSSSAAGLPHTQDALKMGLSAQKNKIADFRMQLHLLYCNCVAAFWECEGLCRSVSAVFQSVTHI